MADAVAKTSTPDAAAGNPIDVTSVVTGAGAVDRQRVSLGDSQGVNPDIRPTAGGSMPVDGSGVTQPVAVTNFPATQVVIVTALDNFAPWDDPEHFESDAAMPAFSAWG